MSRDYSLGHVFAILSCDVNKFKNEVVDTFLFDEDLNGNNGKEYLPKDVVAAGYDSAIEWAIDKAIETYGISKDTITYFLSLTIGSDGYYDSYEYEVVDNGDNLIVSVAYMCGN